MPHPPQDLSKKAVNGKETWILGRWGEMMVAKELRQRGYTVLASNYRCRFGEIDLIATDDKYLVFIEVKLRKNPRFAPACAAVDVRKQQRLRITAECYLAVHPTTLQPRFDVAEIYAPQGTATIAPSIHFIANAF